MKEKFQKVFYAVVVFIIEHKAISLISLLLAVSIIAGAIVLPNFKTPSKTEVSSNKVSSVSVVESEASHVSDKETTSSEITSTESQEDTAS